jgi:phosphoglycolate phosphatase
VFDLVIFDLDGTLVDTAPELSDAVNDTLETLGYAPVSEALVRAWIGHGVRELMLKAFSHSSDWSEEALCRSGAIDHAMLVFAGHYAARCGTRAGPYPGVEATLQALGEFSVRTALVTNKERRYASSLLTSLGLLRYFDPLVAGDSLHEKKPHPLPLQVCLRAHAIPPERALFVGDSSIDIETARNAGVAVWVVPYGYNQGRPIAASQPDRVIATVTEVLEAVGADRSVGRHGAVAARGCGPVLL